jgi:hypothetical protein
MVSDGAELSVCKVNALYTRAQSRTRVNTRVCVHLCACESAFMLALDGECVLHQQLCLYEPHEGTTDEV